MNVFRKQKQQAATVAQSVERSEPKYDRPKVLLIDAEREVAITLKTAGYNISVGSFGSPYRVGKGSGFAPVVIPNVKLPNYTEREIVVVELSLGEPTEQPEGDKATPEDENDWWASRRMGIVDPRPRVMAMVQSHFDRILSNGGVFIVFAEARARQELILASQQHRGLHKDRDLRYDNWGFLSVLGGVEANSDHGEEMKVSRKDFLLSKLLADSLDGSDFTCTLAPAYWLEKFWLPLAENKYGATVGAVIAPDKESNRKGWVIILPQVAHKAPLIARLFKEFLPLASPELFPHAEGQRWVHRPEYELPAVLLMQKEIASVQQAANEKVAALEADMDQLHRDNQYLYELLRATGRPLVLAAMKALEMLGFQSIVDVDEEMKRNGKERALREDLQIQDQSPVLIVDVKGVSGHPADDEALQAQKHTLIRIKEWKRTDVRGLTLINHQKHLPPLDRENQMPFRQEIIDNAVQTDLALMTTWDLFRLVRNCLRYSWRPAQVQSIFYQSGRILPIPAHYRYLGVVKQIWKNALSIQIEAEELRQGDRVSFELPVDFEERTVTSLQLNNMPVQSAACGTEIGVQTDEPVANLKAGFRVFKVAVNHDH